MSYYCTRQTVRKDKDGNQEECGGEIEDGECSTCGERMTTTTSTLFQVTASMVKCSITLTKEDVGLWCFLVKGRYHGFASTRVRAALMRQALLE